MKGMKMPKAQFQNISTLYHVEGTIFAYPYGKARAELSVDYNKRKSYPLIPVPEPHGRLGDLDRLAKEVEDMVKEFPLDSIGAELYRLFAEFIKTAPTVIPAEPPKEEKGKNYVDVMNDAGLTCKDCYFSKEWCNDDSAICEDETGLCERFDPVD